MVVAWIAGGAIEGLVAGTVVAGSCATVNLIRPEMTCPSTLTSLQRVVMEPERFAGNANWMMNSVAPYVGGASFVRTPSPLMTSPDAEERGTDLAKVTTHTEGEEVSVAPLLGLLSTNVLCANATLLVMEVIAKTVAKTVIARRKMRRLINGTVATGQQLVKRYHLIGNSFRRRKLFEAFA